MIVADNITKRFGQLTAVDRVGFSIERGEIVGFIGPNGAGKTTTMRILTGFLSPTEGRGVVAGHDVFEDPMSVRRKVGYLPETPPLYRELSVGDYLRFVAEIREVPKTRRAARIGEIMERVGLAGWEHRILGSLSKGYRQRVGLAQAVLHQPEVLILDEPTSGLDPAQVVGIREFIRGLAADRTVVLSTHILAEVELLCDRVIMIDKGRIVRDDSLDNMRIQAAGGLRYRVALQAPEVPAGELPRLVSELPGVTQVMPQPDDDGFAVLDITAEADPRAEIFAHAAARSWRVRDLERRVPRLEAAFLEIVGRER